MRVAAAPVQLALPTGDVADAGERWWTLPEVARRQVLGLLAALIARSVLVEPIDALEGEQSPSGEVFDE